MTKKWYAWHLFYAGDLNDLIAGPIHAFFKEHADCFFMRYWTGGPHIRLRIKLDEAEKTNFEDKLKAHFQEFLTSAQVENQWEEDWYPKGSIQPMVYEPETDRYAGEVGLPISEKFFEASSRVVSTLMNDSEDWSYEQALGSAIQLQLAFVVGLGMKRLEAAEYFRYFFASWVEDVDVRMKGVEDSEFKEKVFKAFEESFSNQSEVLQNIVNSAWEAFDTEEKTELPFLDDWKAASQTFKFEMDQKSEKIDLNSLPIFKRMPDNMKLWFLYNSHSHMLNNRLGLLNQDEAFLGFILFRCLEA